MAAKFWGIIGRWAAAAAVAGCLNVGATYAQGASAFVPNQFNPYQGSGNVQYGAGNRYNPYNNPYNNPYYFAPNVNPNSLPPGSVVLPNGQLLMPDGTTIDKGAAGQNGGGTLPPGVGIPGTGANTTQYPGGGWYQTPDGTWVPIPRNGTVTQNPFDGKPPAHVGLKRKSPRVSIKSPWSEKSFQDAHSYDKAKDNRPIGSSKPQ